MSNSNSGGASDGQARLCAPSAADFAATTVEARVYRHLARLRIGRKDGAAYHRGSGHAPQSAALGESGGNVGRRPCAEGLRAYLGTIPDYTGGGRPGVKLSGVRPGSPADKAGLKAGDVIVGLAHKRIANIYDYTYALEAVKIGTPVEIVIERGGKQITQTVVPTQRK